MRILIVCHSPCTDGSTAKWAAWKHFGDTAEYLSENHAHWKITKDLLTQDLSNTMVIYIDICPPRAMLLEVHKKAKVLRVIDHHKTAFEDVGDLPFCFFDMNRSGAGLSWDIFNSGKPRPLLIDVVEDADLFKWKVPDARLFSLWIYIQRFSFEKWNEISDRFQKDPESVLAEARVMKQYQDRVISSLITNRKIHWIEFKRAGVKMPAINAPLMQSQIGAIISDKHKSKMACIYYRNSEGYPMSLRSQNPTGPDVSAIAGVYGGGGHKHASGMFIPSLGELEAKGEIAFSEMTEEEIEEHLDLFELE